MALLERTYTIPLRRDFIKVPKHRRAKRAISEIKSFIAKHMKTEDVRVGKELNLSIWSNGIKNPPGKVKVKAIKNDEFVSVELEGFDYKTEKIQTEKTEETKGLKSKLQEAMNVKDDGKEEAKPEEKKAEPKKEEVKPAEKEEKKPEPAKKPTAETNKPVNTESKKE